MDTTDRQAIAGLFEKLAQVERQAPARDAEAESFIAEAVGRQPGAPYYLAQTVVVQEHALAAAQARIAQLEADLKTARAAADDGGFLSGLFGSTPPLRRPARPVPPLPMGAPGGFLAGAAQTAMGVAGGMLLAGAIAGAFAGGAEAAGELEGLAEDDTDDAGDFGFGDDADW